MGQSARNVMQDLRNSVDTASEGWRAYKAAVAPAYASAYQEHKAALHRAEDSLQLESKVFWSIFTTVVGIAAASPWFGRLLEPLENVKLLQNEISKKILEKIEDTIDDKVDDLLDKLKDSQLEKEAEAANEDRPWEPVTDDPYTYEHKMEESLARLAQSQKATLDDLIQRADVWEWGDAYVFSLRYKDISPYLRAPNVNEKYKVKFRVDSELAMWMEWALHINELDEYADSHRQTALHSAKLWRTMFAMGRVDGSAIMRRLAMLGVPVKQYTRDSNPGYLDLEAMAKWAKQNKPRKPPEVERVSRPAPMLVRRSSQLVSRR